MGSWSLFRAALLFISPICLETEARDRGNSGSEAPCSQRQMFLPQDVMEHATKLALMNQQTKAGAHQKAIQSADKTRRRLLPGFMEV